MKRVVKIGGGLAAGAVLGLGVLVVRAPDPHVLLAARPAPALEIVDRHGVPLRLTAGEDGVRFRPVDLGHVSPHLVNAVLAAEDRRFFRHPGVDPIGLVRALWQDVCAGRVVSGGSTLTMQLARVLDPHPRSVAAKSAQIALALRLEAACSKREILAEYLSRAPLGNRIVGFEAAAQVYLGKPASQLSPAEAALLAAVPRSPSRTNPWQGESALKARRDLILGWMARLGALDAAALAAARAEPVVLATEPFRYAAPHFLARVADETTSAPAGAARIVTTLDLALQERVERIVRAHLAELAPHGVDHMAVVVLDLRGRQWLALEGSGGFWDRPGGQQDGTRAPRQPGSALKPFTYAAAFDRGFSPASVLPDIQHAFVWQGGTWTPRNYDERFHGPLRAREALACSVNVPAAFLLQAIGPPALLGELRSAGISTLDKDPSYYGLGLTLGAGEVRLDELTLAYAALLRGGEWQSASCVCALVDARGHAVWRPHLDVPRRVCSPEAAAQVVDVLADPEARAAAFGLWSVLRLPFAAAVKTGTSEGFRDNWCVGGTRDVVVGVWAGNFDRSPMGNVSGVSGAGAVWREVMLAWAEIERRGVDLATADTLGATPPTLVRSNSCALSGLEPSPACPAVLRELLRPAPTTTQRCNWHRRGADGRVSVRWPPLYRDWATREGLLRAGQAAITIAARGDRTHPTVDPTRGAALAIVSPAHEDAFVISPDLPRRFQSIELRCSVEGDPTEVSWLVDGAEVFRCGPPYTTSWRLEPGIHRIQASAGKAQSWPVTITVYGR